MAKITFNTALSKLASTLHSAHVTIESTLAKVGALRTEAVNMVIDAGLAAKKTGAEIKEAIAHVFAEAEAKGELTASTVKAYTAGLAFALDHGIAWTPSLHGLDAQVAAVTQAGKELPKALKAKVEKAEAKKAEREAKTSKASVANKASIVRHLAKALADARTIGSQHAGDILDVIHCFDPEFKEPDAAPI